MAYVGITDKLVNSVEGVMRNLCSAELAALGKENTFTDRLLADPEFNAAIDKVLWGEYIDLKPRLFKFNKTCPVVLTLPITGSDVAVWRVGFEINGPCFSKHDNWNAREITKEEIAGLNIYHLETMQALRAFIDARYECETRWATATNQVKKFLNAAKSLNEAVKLWPDLRRYIDDDTLTRLDAKTERTKTASAAADVLATVDIDAINTNTVLARMAGATLP